jgi:NTE family protein
LPGEGRRADLKCVSSSLDHIVASGSLPPSFPMTVIDGKPYWDGGLFDNTPLGAILDRLDAATGVERTIYVVNLFPNKAPVPRTMLEVTERIQNLQFANKTFEDVKMLRRISLLACHSARRAFTVFC